jgi:hypothetical protein
MRCCSLALVLIRRLSESSQKVLAEATRGAKRKASSLDLQQNEDDKEEDEKQQQAEKASAVSKEKEQAALMSRIANVKLQVAALLSFKDALCSGKSLPVALLWCSVVQVCTAPGLVGRCVCAAPWSTMLGVRTM